MTSTQNEKTITIDVPEERVPEFYGWFARFLASEGGPRGRRRGGPGGRGRHGHHGHCHHPHHRTEDGPTVEPEPTEA